MHSCLRTQNSYNQANTPLFNVKNNSIRKRCKTCSNLTIKTKEQRFFGVVIVNFEHILQLFLVSMLLTLNSSISSRYLSQLFLFEVRT